MGFLSAFVKLKPQEKLAAKMDKIFAKIQTLSIHRPTAVHQCQSRNQNSTLCSSAPFPPQLTTQEDDMASYGDDVRAMISRMLIEDESFRVIPIMGMEGIGKTTLAKLIFNHKAIIDHFTLGVWTLDGYRYLLRDKDNIVEFDLNQLLAVRSCYEEEMQRLKASFIKNRSLIVLDHSYFPYEML